MVINRAKQMVINRAHPNTRKGVVVLARLAYKEVCHVLLLYYKINIFQKEIKIPDQHKSGFFYFEIAP